MNQISPPPKGSKFSEPPKGTEFLEPLRAPEFSEAPTRGTATNGDPDNFATSTRARKAGPYPDVNLNTEMAFVSPAALLVLAAETLWPRSRRSNGYSMSKDVAHVVLYDAAAMAVKAGLKNWQIIETKLATADPDERFSLCLEICMHLSAGQFVGIMMASQYPPGAKKYPPDWL